MAIKMEPAIKRRGSVYVSAGQSTARKLVNDIFAAISPSLQLVLHGLIEAIRNKEGGMSAGDITVDASSSNNNTVTETFERFALEVSRVHCVRTKNAEEAKSYSVPTARKEVRTPGSLRVQLISASGLKAVDLGGTSDPYVVAQIGGQIGGQKRSSVVPKNVNPSFGGEALEFEEMILEDALAGGLMLSVWDKNRMRPDVKLGEVSVSLEPLRRKHTKHTMTEALSGQGSIVFSIEFVEASSTEAAAAQRDDKTPPVPTAQHAGAGEAETAPALPAASSTLRAPTRGGRPLADTRRTSIIGAFYTAEEEGKLDEYHAQIEALEAADWTTHKRQQAAQEPVAAATRKQRWCCGGTNPVDAPEGGDDAVASADVAVVMPHAKVPLGKRIGTRIRRVWDTAIKKAARSPMREADDAGLGSFTMVDGALLSAEVLTLDLDIELRICFDGCAPGMEADSSTALELTIIKKAISWFPILVRVRDLRLTATIRLSIDFTANKLRICFPPEASRPQLFWDVDTKVARARPHASVPPMVHRRPCRTPPTLLERPMTCPRCVLVSSQVGLFPIPNYIDGVLPEKLANFLVTKWPPEKPLSLNFDVRKILYSALILGKSIEPVVASYAVPTSITDEQLEVMATNMEKKAKHLREILEERKKTVAEALALVEDMD